MLTTFLLLLKYYRNNSMQSSRYILELSFTNFAILSIIKHSKFVKILIIDILYKYGGLLNNCIRRFEYEYQ